VDVGPGWVAEGEGFWGCGFGCVGALGVGCFLFFGVGLRWVVDGSWWAFCRVHWFCGHLRRVVLG
jgi:hypothetical protein